MPARQFDENSLANFENDANFSSKTRLSVPTTPTTSENKLRPVEINAIKSEIPECTARNGSTHSFQNSNKPRHFCGQANMIQRRYYWRMRCAKDGTHSQTTDVMSKCELDVPADHRAAEDAFGDASGEYSEEKLTQEIEMSSQVDASAEIEQEHGDRVKIFKSKALERALGGKNIELSGEQKAVLHLVSNTNKNVFFTGAAGTGKSVLLRCMIALLKEKHRGKVYVAAYTGIAACNIGGTTLHRWAGIGIGNQPVDQLVKRVRGNRKTLERWRKTKVLLIDEVSMLSVSSLKKLEEIARIIRHSDLPFGGIQIICTGDLFQLPPIDQADSRFCFETDVWDKIIDRTVNLTQVFRQKDERFANMSNEMRMGHVSKEANEVMCSLSRPPRSPKGSVPTRSFPTRNEVSNANKDALDRIEGTCYEYDCEDWKKLGPEAAYIDIEKHTIAERRITLKVGAQVMLIKNSDDTLVNGSIGRVVGFMTNGLTMVGESTVQDEKPNQRRSKTISSRFASEYPTTAAELLGLPKTEAEDPSDMTASMKRKRLLADKISDEAAKHTSVVPVVRFVTANNTVRFLMVQPETWEVTNVDGEVIASRTQVPLILAWALSVHKSQGQTLPYVSVNLARIFEYGQAYVAISRAISLEGLQVLNFAPHKISASRVVTQFYEKLATISGEEIQLAEKFFEDVLVETRSISSSDEDEFSKLNIIGDPDCKTAEKAKVKSIKKENTEEFSETNYVHSSSDLDEESVRTEYTAPSPSATFPTFPYSAQASFATISSQPPIQLGDSNECMFSEFDSDDFVDYANAAVCRKFNSEGSEKLSKRRRPMVFSSSQSQAH